MNQVKYIIKELVKSKAYVNSYRRQEEMKDTARNPLTWSALQVV